MKHTISILKQSSNLTGYAFMDMYGHCIIIVYGEKQRDLMNKYLKNARL